MQEQAIQQSSQLAQRILPPFSRLLHSQLHFNLDTCFLSTPVLLDSFTVAFSNAAFSDTGTVSPQPPPMKRPSPPVSVTPTPMSAPAAALPMPAAVAVAVTKAASKQPSPAPSRASPSPSETIEVDYRSECLFEHGLDCRSSKGRERHLGCLTPKRLSLGVWLQTLSWRTYWLTCLS